METIGIFSSNLKVLPVLSLAYWGSKVKDGGCTRAFKRRLSYRLWISKQKAHFKGSSELALSPLNPKP